MGDIETVGGKNASLGEMIRALGALGIRVPGGFATTAHAYREFLAQGGLDARIRAELARLDVDDVARLAATGARIRQWILETPLPPPLAAAVSAELRDRKSTRLNSSHQINSYAVYCSAAHPYPRPFPTRRSSDLPPLTPIASSWRRGASTRASAPSSRASMSMTWRGSPRPARASGSGFWRRPCRRRSRRR